MTLLENLIVCLAALAVLFVGSTVTAFSIVPFDSGIPCVAVDSELATAAWLEAQRLRHEASAGTVEVRFSDEAVEPVEPTKRDRQRARTDYWVGDDSVSEEERVPGVPGVRKIRGLKYAKRKRIPRLLYERIKTVREGMRLAREGGGEFVETDLGPAYQVNWVNQGSALSTLAGLRKGDRIHAVNGQQVGKSPASGRALFQALKGEKSFSVLVEREGKLVVLSFEVAH